jgi:hypothetical protein
LGTGGDDQRLHPPINEFTTPYRIINYHVCNSCWNDPRLHFAPGDFLRCPRHKDTPRQFECTRLIKADHVKAVLHRIPGFGGTARGAFRRHVKRPLGRRITGLLEKPAGSVLVKDLYHHFAKFLHRT